MVDAFVADVSDMQQAIDAAQINERTVIGDVLDHAFDDLTFGKVLDQAGALFSTGFFKNGTARDNDVAAATVHFQNDEWLCDIHQRGNVAHGADIDLAAGQKRNSAAKVNGKAAFDAAKDNAFNAFFSGEFAFERIPRSFAACAVARQYRFAVHIFDAINIDFDFIANGESRWLTRHGEFTKRNAAFGFQTHVDHGMVIVDCGNGAFYNAAFKATFCTTK